MVIIQAAGGLGNQMQQYALYRKLVSLGMETRLDISWFTQQGRQEKVYAKRQLELDFFSGVEYKVCTLQEKQALVGKNSLWKRIKGRLLPGSSRIFQESEMYHPEIFDFQDKYVCGYFACEKYYGDILPVLRREFTFPESSNPENQRLAAEILQKETVDRADREAISLHVRRGDYLDAENAAMFGNICTESYYEGAIREMKSRFPKAHFYIFSDDIPYVQKRYQGEEYTVVDVNQGKDSFYDIWLMSLCKHHICANSTFSFWGARLNAYSEKVMIRPSIHKNSQQYDAEQMHQLWEGWVLMDNQGQVV